MEETTYFVCGGQEQPSWGETGRLGFSFASGGISPPSKHPTGLEWMVLEDSILPCEDIHHLVKSVVDTCTSGYRGVICDFEKPPTPPFYDIIRQLGTWLPEKKRGLMVPAAYDSATHYGFIMGQTSPLSGDFSTQCKKLQNQYKSRLVLEISAISMTIKLPFASGAESPATVQSGGFYSPTLGCNYQFHGDSVSLFDIGNTMQKRTELAKKIRISRFIGLHQELYTL
ncbi:MAG: hypothetical protein R3Y62_03590 [Eubacteriales bacterium]